MNTARLDLSHHLLHQVFPFHLCLDRRLSVVQFGPSLHKIYADLAADSPFTQWFHILSPTVPPDFEAICEQAFTVFFVEHREQRFTLKGQMLPMTHDGNPYLLFICSPVVRDLADLAALGLSLKDFPIHDTIVDLLVLLQAKNNTLNDVHKMAERLKKEVKTRRQAEEELKVINKELEKERNKLTTIILTSREGIVVTGKMEEVVLVNPAAEQLLGKSVHQIVQEGFLQLVDDPDYVRAFLDKSRRDLPETVVYRQRVLNFYASTIEAEQEGKIGSAALIRDVTEEKRLEEELRRLSIVDGLTGLFNRRRLDALLVEELNRAIRYDLPLGLLLVDIDHFKHLNDTHGHAQGDRVLQTIGKLMKSHFRATDHACRYGGEEFVAILPNTNPTMAVMVAERLRQRVEAMVVNDVRVTISVGVAAYPESGAETPESLLAAADQALYRAKTHGRNRVCGLEN